MNDLFLPDAQGLYDPRNEHDACGVGFVAHIKGRKTHAIVEQGLTVLKNLTHRGAVGWDPKLSDGSGILIQIPDRLLREEMARQGVQLPPLGQYGVGMVFLPRDPASRQACEYEIERAVKDEGQALLGWRDVPVDNADLAEPAKKLEPVIRQVFIGRGRGVTVTDALERKLYIIRKSSGHAIQALKLAHGRQFYVPSMSARTVIYKGMLLANQVGEYYLDLKDARCESALALIHQRFSTNTFPSWDLAHPFRMIAHNGEINTVRGNVNWIRARQGAISSPVLGDDLDKIWPLIYDGQSDSASFDNALELLVMGGYSVAHAMMTMIPEAWENHSLMDPARRAFYEYHAAMMEPWDGPASIAFTDGRQIGATLDRNGLRPSRYIVTDDDLVIMGSECGCLPVPEEKIVKKWRLQPGKMFLVDLEKGRIVDDKELKDTLSGARPYAEWIERIRVKLDEVESEKTAPLKSAVPLLDRQQAFAYTQEEIKFLMTPMSQSGEEPVGSMGNDSPLAVLSDRNKTLYHYFKQLFAQVTNPPIDPIREELVTSLVSFIGPKPNLLGIDEMNPPLRLEVSQPVLDFYEMEKIRHIERYTGGKFRSHELDVTYPVAWGKEALEARLASLCAQAEDAVRAGASIIVVSDRLVDRERVAIPALLALSAIHQHLVGKGLRASERDGERILADLVEAVLGAIRASNKVFYGMVVAQAQKIAEQFSDEEVQVIGLHAVFEHHAAMGPESLEAFLHEYGWPFPVAIDTPDGVKMPRTMAAYEMRGTPTMLLFDRQGRLRRHYFGHVEDIRLAAELMGLAIEDADAPRAESVAIERKLHATLVDPHAAHAHDHEHGDDCGCGHDHGDGGHAHDHGDTPGATPGKTER